MGFGAKADKVTEEGKNNGENQNLNKEAEAAKTNELTQFEKSVTELHDLLGFDKLNSSLHLP